jgi:hypothetical protein
MRQQEVGIGEAPSGKGRNRRLRETDRRGAARRRGAGQTERPGTGKLADARRTDRQTGEAAPTPSGLRGLN